MDRQTSSGEARTSHLCRTFQLTRQALHAASRPRPSTAPRKPRQGPWVEAETLRSVIRKVVEDHPAWGVRKVWASLRMDGLRTSQKRVYALLRDMGLLLPPSQVGRHPAFRGHVVVPDSNRRWATDLTTVWTRQDGVVAVAPVVDCGDRTCLALHVSMSQEARAMLAPVREALLKSFGRSEAVPDGLELRTDHGTQYTSADCRAFCGEWHLNHTFAPVGRPTGNAVAERLIQTLKLECIWLKDWESRAELQAALDVWRQDYNQRRPHQALEWRTPTQQRTKNLAKAHPATA